MNLYENHDVATDARPRREKAWGRRAVDQVIAWMFTIDGVPMLFCGNELADADEGHSMFGKTPMDWSQLERESGKSRHALVKELAALRRSHASFTAFNGKDGLTWLTASATNAVSVFARRGGGETLIVVQNWTDKPVDCEIDFKAPKEAVPSYIALEEVDRDVKGKVDFQPLHAYEAHWMGGRRFSLGPWGRWISRVTP